MTLRLAIITDIHHGADVQTKCGRAALALTRQFVEDVNILKPDAVIEMGDRISDIDPETDRRLASEVAEVLAGIKIPRFHVNGNHDLHYLSVADNAALLGQPLDNRVVQLGDWDLVLWRADPRVHDDGAGGRRLILREQDCQWLEGVMQHAERPQLVVSHIPISPHDPIGNYYFERKPHLAAYPEASRARAALASARGPVVYLCGHVHWNTFSQLGGVFYLSQQSLTESYTTQGLPAAAWGLIELDDNVTWQVFGKDPLSVTFSPRASRWAAPLKPKPRHSQETVS
jgi:hypothetical protein